MFLKTLSESFGTMTFKGLGDEKVNEVDIEN